MKKQKSIYFFVISDTILPNKIWNVRFFRKKTLFNVLHFIENTALFTVLVTACAVR